MTKMINGFSLVELLIVLMLIGLLSSIAMTSYSNIQINAKEKVLKSICYQLQLALEGYFLDESSYPSLSGVSIGDIETDLFDQGYLKSVHQNPFTGDVFSLDDESGLVIYSYDADTAGYNMDVYGHLNDHIILQLTH